MKVEKKNLPKSQVELLVTVSAEEMKPYLEPATLEVSKEMKVEGFRDGKVPYDVLKTKVGDLPILETAARILIQKKMDQLIKDNIKSLVIGQPKVDITKLAPDNDMEFKVVLDLLPKIELKDYKDLGITLDKAKAEDAEVQKMIDQLSESQIKEVLVDRPSKKGDKVMVSIKMFLDKVPVDGGQSQGTAIIIGKDYIIPGFDKELIGAKKGEIKKFTLQYPKDHHQSNLAGKQVEFEVEIKDVFDRQMPELNDEFAKNFGLKSFDELKGNIKKSIQAEKEQKASQKAELDMLDKIIASSSFDEIPDNLIKSETDLMLRELAYHLSTQGAKLEDYLASIKKTKEDIAKDMEPEALKRVKSSLIVREVALKEKIEADKKEVDEEIKKMLDHYKDDNDAIGRINNPAYKHQVANQLMHRKTLDQLRKWNIK